MPVWGFVAESIVCTHGLSRGGSNKENAEAIVSCATMTASKLCTPPPAMTPVAMLSFTTTRSTGAPKRSEPPSSSKRKAMRFAMPADPPSG